MQTRHAAQSLLRTTKKWRWVAIGIGTVLITLFHILPGRIDGDRAVSSFTQQEYADYLEKRIESLMGFYSVPGATVLLLENATEAWSRSFGYADVETGVALRPDSVIKAQSISKSVTAWGVMALAEDGLLPLDSPVKPFLRALEPWSLRESDFPTESITVRQLLSNSAGMPLGAIGVHYRPSDEIPALTETLSGAEARLSRSPGTEFSYSNSGFALLELVVEQVSGMEFADYMEQRVLHPLGMRQSSFTWTPDLEGRIPTGYDLQGNPITTYLYPNKASGELFSTVRDLGRFAAAGMLLDRSGSEGSDKQAVLSRAGVEGLYRAVVAIPGIYGMVSDSYGLGHFVESMNDSRTGEDHTAVFHGGQGLGWMTHFHLIPELGYGIVIVTNSQRSWPFMARLLSDWARRYNLEPPGMSRIATAETVMGIVNSWLLLVLLWYAFELILGVAAGTRRPTRTVKRGRRLLQVGATFALVTLLVWAALQDYLFVTSVFPLHAVRFGLVLLLLAVALSASAALPLKPKN